MRITVNCPSYKRPRVETLDYLPYTKVWVSPEEYDSYVEANGKGSAITKCEPGVQGNLCRVRNHILDREFADGVDVVAIIDDDMEGLYRWYRGREVKISAGEFMWVLEKYSLMAREMGAFFWGVNCNSDRKVYREYTPFSTTSHIGGPFQIFLRDGGLRYDERLPLKEDYDMTLQQLHKYRVVLRANAYHYKVKQSEQTGGCAASRNLVREREQFELLQKKWGSKIVRQDKTAGKEFDYNPIVKPPIKGV